MDVGAKQIRSPDAPSLGPIDRLFAIALLAAVFLVYYPCWYGGFLFDDDVHLLNNPVLQPGGLAKIWVPGGYVNYWPITSTVYWLEHQLWSLHPLGYHLVNLALHAVSALLVWRVLVRLRVPGAMFAAAIFALHPVNVESVAWIAQLKGILSLLLALVSVLFYLSNERQPNRWCYGLAIAAFLLSALAKGAAITLPIVLLACAWWQRGRVERRDLLRVLPYILIGAVMAGLEVWGQQHVAQGEIVRSDGFFSRAAVAGCALWFYLGKLILPLSLSPIYLRWTMDDHSVLSYLPGLTWVALLAWAWWRRSTWGRPVVMLIVCYTALLLPVLGFVNIIFMRYSLVADHWQYIASIVPCAVFAGVSTTLARRFLIRPVAISAALTLLVVLGVLSCLQSSVYADAETFYEKILALNPECWSAHDNLATVLSNRGKIASAVFHYHKALEINPNHAEIYSNLAAALAADGRFDSAIVQYQKALELDPDYAEAHNNLALALVARGQIDSAIVHYQRALEIKPNYAEANNNLALTLLGRGQVDPAIAHFQKALAIKPNFAAAETNLGVALGAKGQSDMAIAHYQRALEIDPDYAEAQYSLGNALLGRGEADLAISHYQRALEIKPRYAEAHDNLAAALAGRGDFNSAIAHYQKALEIKPDDKLARQNLAILLSQRGRSRKGTPYLQPPSR